MDDDHAGAQLFGGGTGRGSCAHLSRGGPLARALLGARGVARAWRADRRPTRRGWRQEERGAARAP
eukprot:scaffold31183_cov31-Tisochrysis_lutea.AAC.8